MTRRLAASAVALIVLPCAAAPNIVRAVIENGVCYGLCGHHAAVDQTGLSEEPADPDASYGGHAAGGDHVGPCGGEWQTNFDLPITQSCCREGNNPPQISTGEYACECPMEVTCAGMADASGSGGCVEDIVVDGVVDVNDLLGVLSAYGGTDPAADIDGNGSVDVNDLLGVLSAFGSECSGGAAPEPAAPTCTQGTDCGGQVWNTCASSCPSICGTPGPMMCNSMCNQAYECPLGECFNEASGACEDNSGSLPPGIAPGRPFLSVKEAPLFARVVEHAVSDWVGLIGPDGKHNHDGRVGGDYGQEEEL